MAFIEVMLRALIVSLILLSSSLLAESGFLQDLETADKIEQKINDRLPFLFNYALQGGYFVMPSARDNSAGVGALGFSFLPPYRSYNLYFQLFDRIELTGNYLVFHGIKEGNFGHLGFGDDADRIANIKLLLLKEGDGSPYTPGLAVGFNDFIGSRRFHSEYLCLTKSFLPLNLEATLGYGQKRIKGFFGGVAWTPLRSLGAPFSGLTLAAEWDANDYKHSPKEHPKGRSVKSRLNYGVHLNLFDALQLSCSTLRGEKIAFSSSLYYDFGSTKGLLPKSDDPSLYKAPLNFETLGANRVQEEFVQELAYAIKDQGLTLSTVFLSASSELYLQVINLSYRKESDVRERLTHVLASILPSNIVKVTVAIESDGIVVQAYCWQGADLRNFQNGQIAYPELSALSPLIEAPPSPSIWEQQLLYKKEKNVAILTLAPRLIPYFGSSSGKIKYNLGLLGGVEGFLWNSLMYMVQGSFTALATTQNMGDRDMLNPSHLLHVRSDSTQYRKGASFHLERLYLQKAWNLPRSCFARFATGYFEIAYAGVAGEFLYYPLSSFWALGLESAIVLKRKYDGIAFQHKVIKFQNDRWQKVHFVGYQYFLNLYLHIPPLSSDLEISVGKFLARDKGARFELFRYFDSGVRVSFWYTLTDGKDRVNHKRYFDKGLSFVIPLDIFMKKSSRSFSCLAASAWLRDVGARAETGKTLYPIVRMERE